MSALRMQDWDDWLMRDLVSLNRRLEKPRRTVVRHIFGLGESTSRSFRFR